MWKLLRSKRGARGEALVLLALGGLATYLNAKIGVPVLVVLLGIGIWLIVTADKRETEPTISQLHDTEWKHYDKLKDALLDLQRDEANLITIDQILHLLKTVKEELVYLDDKELRNQLTYFISKVESECMQFNYIPPTYINKIINDTADRMNKRYPR